MSNLRLCKKLTLEESEKVLGQVAFVVAHRFISGLPIGDYRVVHFPYVPGDAAQNNSGYIEIQKVSPCWWLPLFLARSIVAYIDTSFFRGPDGTRTQVIISLSEDWEDEAGRLSQIYYQVAQEFGLPESLHVALVIH